MRLTEREPRETGRDYALRTIKDSIICLELPPGCMVSENELAAQMGLSRTPVREALQELSKVRLVDIYPQRGSAVALIDYDLVAEARFMRHVLECAVVEQVCAQAQPEHLLALESNVQLQERCQQLDATDRLWALDNEFHRLLFQLAGKELTWHMMKGFTAHFDRVRNMSLNALKSPKTVQEHRAIYTAVAQRNLPEARQLMSQHLTRYQVDAQALRERYPAEYFKSNI